MLLGLSGLPFTPNDNGLAGFGMVGSFPGFLFLFPLIFLFYSLVRAILEKEDLDNPMREQWAALVSPIGLLFPMVTPWIISLTWLARCNVIQFIRTRNYRDNWGDWLYSLVLRQI